MRRGKWSKGQDSHGKCEFLQMPEPVELYVDGHWKTNRGGAHWIEADPGKPWFSNGMAGLVRNPPHGCLKGKNRPLRAHCLARSAMQPPPPVDALTLARVVTVVRPAHVRPRGRVRIHLRAGVLLQEIRRPCQGDAPSRLPPTHRTR